MENKDIEYYESLFKTLHTNVYKGKSAPHKAMLLLSIFDLIEDGTIYDSHIQLTDELEQTYKKLWEKLLDKSLLFSPDVYKPYYHMDYEQFWRLIPVDEKCNVGSVVSMSKEDPRYTKNWMRSHYKFAEIDEELFQLLKNENVRAQFRLLLIVTYLVNQPIEIDIKSSVKLTSVGLLSAILGVFVA